MLRRRLLSIVGAVGLIAGLISSGVAVQADTAAPTLDALIATWSGSTQNVCYSNSGTANLDAITGICTISQGASTTQANVAVCVQNNTTVEDCEITQVNVTQDNRALVLQNYNQSGSAFESATQTAHVTQTNGLARDDTWVGQNVYQSTWSAGTQTQIAQQFDGINQNAASGGQKALLGQLSSQRANSTTGATQQQFSDQDAHDSGNHINQSSTGLSEIVVGEAQIQTATGSGFQNQVVDPRCCSNQTGNILDTFKIFQFVYQKNNAAVDDPQDATSVAECHTSGDCTTDQTTTNNTSSTTNHCSGKNCVAVVHCASPGTCTQSSIQCTPNGENTCGIPPVVGCPPSICLPVTIGLLNSRSLIASIASRRAGGAFRFAPGAALLT
jgi:hypothetical protein